MGMSFFVEGDEQTAKYFDCQCRPLGERAANPKCRECEGTGVVRLACDAHEFHVSYTTGFQLLTLLGYASDDDEDSRYAGELPASWELHDKIADLIPIYSRHDERTAQYLSQIQRLILVGLRKGSAKVTWG